MPYADQEIRRAYDKKRDRRAYEKSRYEKRREYVKAAAKASHARLVARTTPQERTEIMNKRLSRSFSARRKEHLKGRYNLSLEQWEMMFDVQGRKCAICSATTSGWKRGWHTDHDHTTGKVRAILCHLCNRTLGCMKEDISRFQTFIDYLTKHAGV